MATYLITSLLIVLLAFFTGWLISARRVERKRQRDRKLWLAIAADLTHQMGTPLSALMGWIDLLPTTKDPQLAVTEMNLSLERLLAISARLAQVGNPWRFENISLGETIERTRSYFLRRIAQSSGIVISTQTEGQPWAKANQELLSWTLEGLVKIAVDAIEGKEGRIILRAREEAGRAILEVEDNGRGIDPRMLNKIEDPGFTPKIGGRDIVLPLAQHIVETGHKGKFTIVRTESGKGNLVRIELEAGSHE
jgi:two-component system, sporulation sensor kinase D